MVEIHRARYVETGAELPCLLSPSSQNLQLFMILEALPTQSFWDFMKASLLIHD